jgi:hypothetical protein
MASAFSPASVAGGATLNIDKVGGAHWLWNVDQQISGRQLELNDAGYLDRKNDYLGAFSLMYRTIELWWKTIETRTTARGRAPHAGGIDLVRAGSLTS